MPLAEVLASLLAERRDDVALEYEEPVGAVRQLTFGELDARANAMTAALARRGLAAGDRLCVRLPNSVAFIDILLACARLGVILVPINVMYRERELAHIVGDADPVAVVTLNGTDELPGGVAQWSVKELTTEATGTDASLPRPHVRGDDPALLIYTSGTTGRSKGAVLTHDNLIANARTLVDAWRITSADRLLLVLPLFHVHGLGNGIMTWLLTGYRLRLAERFEAARAAAWFREFSPTLFFGVPTVYVRLLELPDGATPAIAGRMRLFVSGSAPLPAHVLDAFGARYGHTILERYGMSETLMICSNPYEGERRAGTVGPPLPGVSVRLVGDDGHPVAAGATGELWVRSPAVSRGYWRRPDADAASWVDGWFRTGDIADVASDGYVTLRGRRTDLIISGGFNIYPREIEEVLLELPGVREAVVAGVPDPTRGEVPVAWVAGEPGLDVAALEAACRRQLASFKVPRTFRVVDALPRTALGKIQRHLLPPIA